MVSRRGHVLTNAHVVQECREVRIGLDSKPGTVAAVVATFRDGRGLRQGDTVLAVGFPLRGLLASQASLTVGTVSGLAGPRDDTRYLQITAPVETGNSGGPLLDQSGHLVGVIVSQLDALPVAQQTGNIPQNVNFAIHASVVRTFLDAHRVEYEIAASVKMLQASDIGDRAKTYTLVVECWK